MSDLCRERLGELSDRVLVALAAETYRMRGANDQFRDDLMMALAERLLKRVEDKPTP